MAHLKNGGFMNARIKKKRKKMFDEWYDLMHVHVDYVSWKLNRYVRKKRQYAHYCASHGWLIKPPFPK